MVSNYDDIVLTPEEEQEALRVARKRKHELKVEQDYWEKVNKPIEYGKLNCENLRAKILIENKDLIIDENNANIFNMLCAYFSGDESFESIFDGSFKKGIMLHGPVGCGKTKMMEVFQENSFRPFVINPVRVVADEYTMKDGGANALIKFSTMVPAYPQMNFGFDLLGRCFDDIGTEDSKKNFGNEVNVIQDLLYKVYDNKLLGNFHGTTNLNGQEIESAYGLRVRDRMKEMFNVINFGKQSPSRRK